MLISFSVGNHRSFRDVATLDMRSPRSSGASARPWDGSLQSVAGVYGANASGKTTFVNAISTMATQVQQSYRQSQVFEDPFIFDSYSRERPTGYTATFIAKDDICYSYSFEVLNGVVVKEWADKYTSRRPTMLFERESNSFRYGVALKGPSRAVEKTVQPTTLFLSAAAAAGHSGLRPVFEWFSEQLHVFPATGHESLLAHVVITLAKDANRRERLAGLLSRADFGLTGLNVEKQDLLDLDPSQAHKVTEALQMLTGQEVSIGFPGESYSAYGVHHLTGHEWTLPLDAESDGTRALLCYGFVIDEALRTGATIVFDEIDRSLHPLLLRELVRVFQDRELNPKQAQLIFTTHDVSLMDSGYGNGTQLNRDEIWLTWKDDAGCSILESVAEYAPRARENLARRYMSGRYGGIPNIVELVDPVLV